LDPSLVYNLIKIFKLLNSSGKTIIISSHRIQELSQLCSRMVLIKEGKMFSVGKSQLDRIYS
jgi:ABC-type multidrug transport system ATPase subunit